MLRRSEVKMVCVSLRFHAQGDQSGPGLCCDDKHLRVWKGLLPEDEPGSRSTGSLSLCVDGSQQHVQAAVLFHTDWTSCGNPAAEAPPPQI